MASNYTAIVPTGTASVFPNTHSRIGTRRKSLRVWHEHDEIASKAAVGSSPLGYRTSSQLQKRPAPLDGDELHNEGVRYRHKDS